MWTSRCVLLGIILICFVLAVSVGYSDNRKLLIDVVFIVDCSARADDRVFKQELLLIPKIVAQLSYVKDKIRFGLITYSDHANIRIGLGYVLDNKALLHRLWKIEHSDSVESKLSYALRLARTYMFTDDSDRNKFVIIFPNSMWNLPQNTNTEVKRLKHIGVKILMVMIDKDIDRESMMEIIDEPSYIYNPHITLNFIQKQHIFNFIVNNIYDNEFPRPTIQIENQNRTTKPVINANTTLLSNTITTTDIQGSMIMTTNSMIHSNTNSTVTSIPTIRSTVALIDTETISLISATSVQTSTRKPLQPRAEIITEEPIIPLPSPCRIGGELGIIMDSSNSVSDTDFQKLLKTCATVVNTIRKSRVPIDIAIVTFSSSSKLEMTYDQYNKTKDITEFIMNIKHRGGLHGIGEALSNILSNVYHYNTTALGLRTILIFSASFQEFGENPTITSGYMKLFHHTQVILITIGNKTKKSQDDGISTKAPIKFKDFDELNKSPDRIIDALCTV